MPTAAARILPFIGAGCALAAALLILFFLVRRPSLRGPAKWWLLLGLGPLPIAAAVSVNLANHEVMRERQFCGRCHAMAPFASDAANANSHTLVARHSRNAWMGARSCSSCHADYAMLRTTTTPAAALSHVVAQYTDEWGPGHRRPHLPDPFPNAPCRRCHSLAVSQAAAHALHAAAIESDSVPCVSGGCHGPAHVAGSVMPNTRP
jgi:cytochrome c-type protein NapC